VESFEAPTLPQHHDGRCLTAERHLCWSSESNNYILEYGKPGNSIRAFDSREGYVELWHLYVVPRRTRPTKIVQGTSLPLSPRLLRPCLSAGFATYQPQPSVDLLQSFHALYYRLSHPSFRGLPDYGLVVATHIRLTTLSPARGWSDWRTYDLVTPSYHQHAQIQPELNPSNGRKLFSLRLSILLSCRPRHLPRRLEYPSPVPICIDICIDGADAKDHRRHSTPSLGTPFKRVCREANIHT
jgi:hypothetical protein